MNGLTPRGGTELSAAMEVFLGSRRSTMPTAAFILTDGKVYDVSHVPSIDGPVTEFP